MYMTPCAGSGTVLLAAGRGSWVVGFGFRYKDLLTVTAERLPLELKSIKNDKGERGWVFLA